MAFVPLSLFISDGSKSSIAFVSTKLSRILSSTTPWTCAGWEEYDDDNTAQTTESCSKHIFETALHLAHALRSTNCPLLHLSTSKVWKVVSFGLVIIGGEYCQFFGLIIIRRRERTCMTQAFVIAGVVFFCHCICHTHSFLNLYIASLVPILSQVW